MTQQEARERLIRNLDGRKVSAQLSLDKFQHNLADHPLYAFKWAEGAFRAAAAHAVATYVQLVIEAGTLDVQGIADMLTRDVLHKAKSPSFSTSVASNLASTYETAETSELCDYVRRLAEEIEK